jgi:Tetratricopeptide repeat/Protein of unknown function (DUF2914)
VAAPSDAMPELQTVPDLLEKAESAAAAGDLSSADELLRAIARIQEHELGSEHPDLANTLNNLAIVAEKTGRPDDAETFYRRAVAIASASLAPDDPMLAASRQNLEDFCRAQGIPIEKRAVIASPAEHAARESPPSVPVKIAVDTKAPVAETVDGGDRAAKPPSPVAAPAPDSRPRAAAVSQPSPAPPPSPSFLKVAIAIVVLVIAALFVMRPWSSGLREPQAAQSVSKGRETPAVEPAAPTPAEPSRSQAPESAQKPSAPPAAEPSTSPAPAPREDNPRAAKPSAADAAAAPVALVTAQLCRTLSTSGNWRCDPAGDTVAAGQLAFYTRVKSPRPTRVVHRWYRGAALRRSVELEISANANEGYRTFSRQTVDAGEQWRVEVRSASGELLHEQRVTVR